MAILQKSGEKSTPGVCDLCWCRSTRLFDPAKSFVRLRELLDALPDIGVAVIRFRNQDQRAANGSKAEKGSYTVNHREDFPTVGTSVVGVTMLSFVREEFEFIWSAPSTSEDALLST
jgi:hypothetical protein